MYLVGQGDQLFGPGTSLVQQIDWVPNQERRMRTAFPNGLSGCSCGGTCGHCGDGLGLFDSMDFTTWGWQEWSLVGLGAYMVLSTFSTTQRGVRSIRRSYRRRMNAATR